MTSWKISSLTDQVRRAFSEAADQYDILASLQREIGRELIKKTIKFPNIHRVLDVGCGTGYLTAKARFFFPESPVIGLDFSEEMLLKLQEKGENVNPVAGDAEHLPFKSQSFDLVVSNLAYQWASHLDQAFSEARRVLSDHGTFEATLFGHHTCDEFFTSLKATGTDITQLNRLPELQTVKEKLSKAGFSKTQVDYERIQIQFKNLYELLGWLKAIGANGLSSGTFLGAKALQVANQYCLKNYPYHEGVQITFEVIWIHANA